MILREQEVCPHSFNCPYAKANGQVCLGTMQREHSFSCDLVKPDGTFVESGQARTTHNTTGKMEVLVEG